MVDQVGGNCAVCHHRDTEQPQTCPYCRTRLRHRLDDLADLHHELAHPEPPQADTATYPVYDREHQPIGHRYRDVVAATMPVANIPRRTDTTAITGSRTPAMPLHAATADLLAPVVRLGGRPVDGTRDTLVPKVTGRWITVTAYIHGHPRDLRLWDRRVERDRHGQVVMVPARDQVGHVPIAQVLDSWVRDWIRERDLREHRPVPTVPVLIGWLYDRLDWACDRYVAVEDFAGSISEVIGHARGALGLCDPQPELCVGVPCRNTRCGLRTLYRTPGDPYVECISCRALLDDDEYEEWCRTVAQALARPRAVSAA
jgi:hypothetical protein